MMSEIKTEEVLATQRQLVGRVVSNKMTKSVVVAVESRVRHPVYDKFLTKTRRFVCHDETNELLEGDVVEIVEGRPISKTKSWIVSKLIKRLA
jgi:small subunit ribosomal protein S17